MVLVRRLAALAQRPAQLAAARALRAPMAVASVRLPSAAQAAAPRTSLEPVQVQAARVVLPAQAALRLAGCHEWQ